MAKYLWKTLKLSPVVLAATFFASNSALAGEIEGVTSVADLSQQRQDNSMGQVTSVSQFSDVQPTDWAFQALQSLVERYGCIAGYPNGTYRGNRALTRYEFAAGLNACLDRVNELIATATADLVTREDLATLQRLQEEFAAELATLRGRVDALEARTAELEANQFSTTTKLKGEAIFNIAGAFGDEKARLNDTDPIEDIDDNITFSNRVRLKLESSFTGTDKLETRLNAGNITGFDDATGTRMARLGFDSFTGDNGNDVEIDKINYAFNFGDALRVKIDATGAELNENVNVFNSDFKSSGTGALFRYGRFSPIYRLARDGAGATLTFNPKGQFSASAGYYAPEGDSPEDPNGVFNGANTVFGQLEFKPSEALNVGFAYARSYQNSGSGINLFNSTGGELANDPFDGAATVSNNYGVQASFRPSSKITVGGWAGFTDASAKSNTLSGVNDGDDAEMFYWAANVGIRDFGGEGNVLGVIFGQPPRVTDNDVAGREDDDTSYHLEALYKFRLTDNIQVTPGLLVLFNPEHNNDNDTIYVGTIRTTFKF
ncbi:MAG: iron uptake porin [Nostocaceae cyanobacterium]|nr:iron uptake porin [Nostocaceae cyanobacterium]